MDRITSLQDIYNVTPSRLCELMAMGAFIDYIPKAVETKEDMDRIANLLPLIVNKYSFLMEVLSSLKVSIRAEKRSGNKELYEDLIDKQTVVSNAVDTLKMQQKTLSRLITIKQMELDEAKMY